MSDITEQIKQRAEQIALIIAKGSRVELLQNKDGLKVLEIKREVVKWYGRKEVLWVSGNIEVP